MTIQKTKSRTVTIIRWTARILSAMIVLFVLLMFIGESLQSRGNDSPISTRAIIALILFPGIYMVGSILAWKCELTGGLITVLCMPIFLLVMGDAPILMLGFALPGLLFILAWLFSHREREAIVEE